MTQPLKLLTSTTNPSIIRQTGQGFIFKCIPLHIHKNIFAYKNIFKFTAFRLLEKCICEIPSYMA